MSFHLNERMLLTVRRKPVSQVSLGTCRSHAQGTRSGRRVGRSWCTVPERLSFHLKERMLLTVRRKPVSQVSLGTCRSHAQGTRSGRRVGRSWCTVPERLSFHLKERMLLTVRRKPVSQVSLGTCRSHAQGTRSGRRGWPELVYRPRKAEFPPQGTNASDRPQKAGVTSFTWYLPLSRSRYSKW